MNTPLPQAIATYFEVTNGADDQSIENCFTCEAIVRDEGTYEGHQAIRVWLQGLRRKYALTVQPLRAIQDNATIKVLALVTGAFPGSPLELEHRFQLINGLIQFLDVG